MKCLLLLPFLLFSLLASAQTTMEEYNYLTKGYAIQLESGLDMKKGYKITDIGNFIYDDGALFSIERSYSFKHLYRVEESEPCATLVITKSKDSKYSSYFCIPHIDSSEDIWAKAKEDFEDKPSSWTSPTSFGLSWSLIQMISQLSTNLGD